MPGKASAARLPKMGSLVVAFVFDVWQNVRMSAISGIDAYESPKNTYAAAHHRIGVGTAFFRSTAEL